MVDIIVDPDAVQLAQLAVDEGRIAEAEELLDAREQREQETRL